MVCRKFPTYYILHTTYPKTISALILNTWNGRKAVACTYNLLEQATDGEMEVIIIDNHSEDDSIGYIRNHFQHDERVQIIETRKNVGFGGGYKEGIQRARGKFILINNPDKIIEEGGLQKMIDKMQSDTSIGIMGPKLMHEDGTVRLSPRAFPHIADVFIKRTPLQHVFKGKMKHYLQLEEDVNAERDVDWLSGGCMLVRADVLKKLNGFDERFFLFFEDIDLCKRCWNLGKKVLYFPSATAYDRKIRYSEMSAFKMPFSRAGREHLKSAVRYFWKWRHL